MRVTLLKSIREIEPDVWNSIVGRNRLICRHEYLLAVESSEINDCRYFYPVIHDDDGRLIAHTCFYYISTELDSFAKGTAKKIITGIRRVWKSFLILRSIECGTPVALGNTISFRDDCDRNAVMGLLVGEAERVAHDMGVPVVLFRDFHDQELAFADILKKDGYSRVNNLPAASFNVRWNTFQGYLDALRSQYRHVIRKRLKAFEEGGYTFREIRDYGNCVGDLARLWKNTYDHATEYRREILGEPFFREMGLNLPSRSSVIMVEKVGRPVAFSILLDDDETLITLFCGLDYSCGREAFIYFNLFYKSIEIAMIRGKQEIDFGITTLVPKVEVGGDVVRLTMYMKCKNSLWGRFVPSLFAAMTPDQRPPVRQIFKDHNKN